MAVPRVAPYDEIYDTDGNLRVGTDEALKSLQAVAHEDEVVRSRMEAAGVADQLRPDQLRPDQLRLVSAGSITPKAARWAWEFRIPLAGVTLVGGREGQGKTVLVIELAARLSRGQLQGDLKGRPLDVIYIGSEDDPETVLAPRLIAAGADLDRVHFVRMSDDWFEVVRHLEELEAQLHRDGIEVAAIIIDPLDAHLGATVDTHKKAAVQAAIGRAAELSQRLDCAVIGVAHLNKGDAKNVLGRIVGSVAFTTSVRSVLGVGEHPDDPRHRVCVLAKANMTDKATVPAVIFKVEGTTIEGDISTARVVMLGEELLEADSILFVPDAEERTKVDEAADWLRDVLAGGSMASRDVKRLGREEGISDSTLKRARPKVAVVERDTSKQGAPTIWSLR